MKNNVISLNNDVSSRRFLRAKDIQKFFNIARATVDNWAKYGYLTRHKIGRNVFYEAEEVEKLKRIGV